MNRKYENVVFGKGSLWLRAAGFLLFCIMMGGCGVQDKALTVPFAGTGDIGVQGESSGSSAGTAAAQAGNAAQEGIVTEKVCVYVCGAVASPGVVELAEGSRVADALEAAGGFAEDAQRDHVNLAAKVSDGEKLYFPTIEEACQLQEQAAESGLVNINTADAALLATLPGIGEAKAQDIIAYREEKGGFAQCEELMQVNGIKRGTYEKLQDKIVAK